MVELSEVVRQLRVELEQAIEASAGQGLRFELGTVELELTVAIEVSGQAGAKLRFWVVETDTQGKTGRVSTQRIKLVLSPRMDESGRSPLISGRTSERER